MRFEISEKLFKDLYPYIIDDDVTDIKWNGYELRIDDLKKGRYVSDVKLSDDFLDIFTTRVSNYVNVNFNASNPSLKAETPELRIQAIHPFVTGDKKYILAIRKTPAIARITNETIVQEGYSDELFPYLIGGIVRAHMSGIIIGDVGAGKTELEKYISGFIPDDEPVVTIEDTLEMKLKQIYPQKDIYSVKVTDAYPAEEAIKDALRTNTKWMLIAEARGREIHEILEGASTGCLAWSTIHTKNVWEIPDRIVQMSGANADKEALENTVHTFFEVGIKVRKDVTENGIFRKIDQICFFDRTDKKNSMVLFMRNGKYTGARIPKKVQTYFEDNNEFVLLNKLEELYNSFKTEGVAYNG